MYVADIELKTLHYCVISLRRETMAEWWEREGQYRLGGKTRPAPEED